MVCMMFTTSVLAAEEVEQNEVIEEIIENPEEVIEEDISEGSEDPEEELSEVGSEDETDIVTPVVTLPENMVVDVSDESVSAIANAVSDTNITVVNKNGQSYNVVAKMVEYWNSYSYHMFAGGQWIFFETVYRASDTGYYHFTNGIRGASWSSPSEFETFTGSGSISYCDTDVFNNDGTAYYLSDLGSAIFTVSFNTGFDDLIIDDQFSDNLVVPDTLTYDNHEFEGWYLDSEFTKPYTSNYIFIENTTLYAKWKSYYYVSFDTGFDDLTINKVSGKDFVLPEVSYEGYVLDGFYLDSEFTEKFELPYEFTEDITLYLKWIEKPAVFFNTGFDDLVFDKQYFDNFVLPEPEYAGYMFLGWYIDSNFEQLFSLDMLKDLNEDITLYAKFTEEPPMTFFAGNIFESLTVLTECQPILYILSIMGLAIIFGVAKTLVISRL